MVFFGSVLILIIIAIILWLSLSPLFPKVGSFIGKKASNFKKKWGEKK
jgi:hypothetical protein